MVQKNFLLKLLKQVAFCSLLPVAYASAVTTLDLPDIGESTGTLLSPEFERRLGQAFLNQVRRQTDVINDPEVETYIQSVGYRLVAQSDNSSQLFTFFVIDDPQINAFAAPGGIVGINTGTITHSETESELAGVIAHEIAHVTQRHMARSAEMTQKMSIPMIAAMLGAILIATQNPDAGAAAIAAVQGGALQAQINFTRGNEEEADRIGMQLLDRAEFNPFGMPSFFTKLQRNSVYMANAPEFLRTHPLTVNRISDTQARAENLTKRPFNESRTYQFIRTKLLVRTFKTPADAIKQFESQLAQSQRDDVPLRYGLALAHMENRDYDSAESILDELIKNDQENLSLQLARADLEVRQAKFDEAVTIYARMLNIYPDYRPLILSYANTLLTAKRPADARTVLEGFAKYNTPDITYFNYLTRAEAESGRPIEAGMANAEYYFLTGETRVAIEQLKSLLRSQPKPDYYQEEKILSRISQLELELKLERDLNLG